MKLQVRFWLVAKKVVVMQILHQDESLRWAGVLAKEEGYEIASYTSPALGSHALCIRGVDCVFDDCLGSHQFSTPEAATRAIAAWSRLIKQINGKTAVPTTTDDVWAFTVPASD